LNKALIICIKASIMIVLIGQVALLALGMESEKVTEGEYDHEINKEDFVKTIDNPYFPLIPGTTFIYEGGSEEENTTIRNEIYVTNRTRVVMGINTTVVRDTEWEDGELVEKTFDWYAQDKDGNVWYFGEDSRKYEDGKVVSTEGSWEAGVNGSKPGVIMEGNPRVGDIYYQEFSPCIAEDQAEVVSLNETVNISYGSFENCLKTREWNQLEPGSEENKYYACGVGTLLEVEVEGGDERLELVKVIIDYGSKIKPENFTGIIDNPYFPLTPGTTFIYEGKSGEENETLRTHVYVSNKSKMIMGVNTTVVKETEYEDKELKEKSLKWYAQDTEGNVWCFGENSTEYEDGVNASYGDSWKAGVNGSKPGIIMKVSPEVGDVYYQAFAPFEGVVEIAEVISLNESVAVPYGSFEDVLKTKEIDLLEPKDDEDVDDEDDEDNEDVDDEDDEDVEDEDDEDVDDEDDEDVDAEDDEDDEDDEEGGEYKYYASDVGLILEEEVDEILELVKITTK